MYKQLLLASTLSLGLLAAPAAMAGDDEHRRGHHRGHDRGDVVKHRDHHGHDRYDHRDDRRHERWDGRRVDDRRWHHEREHRWKGPRFRAAPYVAPRGYYRHTWHAGQRLPYGYRATRYVVHDYRHYRLYAPPRGHHWVRVDRDVVLTAVATGVVAAVIYDLFV